MGNSAVLEIDYLEPQLESFFDIPDGVKINVITKGRRVGLTRGGAQASIEFLLDKLSGLWVDVTQGNLNRYFDKYFKPVLKKLKIRKWKYHRTDKILTINGTELHFRSAERPENIEGFGYHFIMMNETGITLKSSKGRHLYYNSVLPMSIDHDAVMFLFGVPKGELADKKEKEEQDKIDEEKREQAELSKGDKAKILDLKNDLKTLSSKYEFKSKKNQEMYLHVSAVLNQLIGEI